MSEKNVSRTVATALVIICVILVVGLLGAIANYTSIIYNKDKIISTYDSQIQTLTNELNQLQAWLDGNITWLSQLQTWLDGNRTYYQNEIARKDSQITSLEGQIDSLSLQIANLQNQMSSLNAQISSLDDIVKLNKWTILIDNQTVSQPASYYTYWIFPLDYAGYVEVWVQSSTTNNTYARVIYGSCDVNYNHAITVGTSGMAVFPILPSGDVEVMVGNTNLSDAAIETVTIIYCY